MTTQTEALAKPAQPKYRRGNRLICLETEEYCVIHISGTDRQWVKFPTSYIGVYTNEQVAELFELLPKEPEQPAQQEPVAWQWLGEAHFRKKIPKHSDISDWSPLYRTPQRTWVGLTVEDMAICIDEPAWDLILRKAEQILKEKNT